MIDQTFKLGGTLTINRLGFGAMRLTAQPGNFGAFPDWEGGVALLRKAADLGVTFFDSARAYGPQWADRIVGEALGQRDVVLATKGGIDKFSPTELKRDASPQTLLAQIEDARKNLQRDTIDLFQLHWVDPQTPLERTIEALASAQEKRQILHIGLSNVSVEELERARAIAPIASVQNRFNMAEDDQSEMVDHTAKHGIAFIPYGPLGANPMQKGAKLNPPEALAWLLKRSPNIVPIPGTTSLDHLQENWGAWGLT
ncbi:MAG: aldo/keto reductase [Pseudomonadota bacterium]